MLLYIGLTAMGRCPELEYIALSGRGHGKKYAPSRRLKCLLHNYWQLYLLI